jgi:hypothetical protein
MLFLLYTATFVISGSSHGIRSLLPAGDSDQRCSLLLGFCLPLAAHQLAKIQAFDDGQWIGSRSCSRDFHLF